MQVTLCKEPFEYIIIDNTYTEEELKLIFLELDFWTMSGNLLDPSETGSALNKEGLPKKKNKGVFLDTLYTNRSSSKILELNRKIYKIQTKQPSVIINFLQESDSDTTLISYYENEEYYKSHRDVSVLTAVTYLYKQPKLFEGGNLILTDYGYQFEPWFNRTYIMPGVVEHEVTEVTMKTEDLGKGLGRYCISNFINIDRRKLIEQVSNPV